MGWILQDPRDKAIIAEIEKQSDRGAIVVAVSFLEWRLEQTLRLRMMPEEDPEIIGRMFKGYGPLSTFAAKIDMGFWLQLYPVEMQSFLHKLRDLRNDAAHEPVTIGFDVATVRDRCRHLSGILTEVIYACEQHRNALITATRHMPMPAKLDVVADDGSPMEGWQVSMKPEDARSLFLACIKAVLMCLQRVAEIFALTQLKLPPSKPPPPWLDKSARQPTRQAQRPSRGRKKP